MGIQLSTHFTKWVGGLPVFRPSWRAIVAGLVELLSACILVAGSYRACRRF
jgi:hypothetical protein